jgi:hypothetical protein
MSGAKHVNYYDSVVFSPRRGHSERSTKVLKGNKEMGISHNMGSMWTGSTTVVM